MMNIFLLKEPNFKYRTRFKELKDKLEKDRATLQRLEKQHKALNQEMDNIPSAREAKETEAAVQRHRQVREDLEHERTVRLAQLQLPVSEREQAATEFLSSVTESRDRREIEADKILNRVQIEGVAGLLQETERKLEQARLKSFKANLSSSEQPKSRRWSEKAKASLREARAKLIEMMSRARDQAGKNIGIKEEINNTEAEMSSLRDNMPWKRERLDFIFLSSGQTEEEDRVRTAGLSFQKAALDTCIRALVYCSQQLNDLSWKVLSNGFHHIERRLFDDIRLCWHMCALVLHRFYTAGNPDGKLPEDGLPTVATSPWTLDVLMSVIQKLWSPNGIFTNFPDERHDDPYYLARFYDEFGVLMNDGTEGKTGFTSDDFRNYFDCIRPQKHQPETGKDVIETMLKSHAPDNIVGLAITIQTFFTLGCYSDSRPCLLGQEELGPLLDLYSRRNRVRPIDQAMMEEFYLDKNHYVVGLLASKEYINYAYNQALPAMREMSPQIDKYREEIRDVCDRWRSERTTVYITPQLYTDMKKLKSKMANYGAILRYPCGFWWMVERKHREGKNKSNRKKKEDGSTFKTRQSRSMAARYALELRKQRGLPVGYDLDEKMKDAEQKEQNRQFAQLQQTHWLFTSDALINARAEIVAWLTCSEITTWEQEVLELAEALPYQRADFLAVWRFGVLVGLHLGMNQDDETLMLLLIIDFYCKRLGPSTTDTAIREACRHSMVIRAASVLWNSFMSIVQTPIPVNAVERQNIALFNRMSAFFSSKDKFPANADYLLFCTVCGMVMSIINYAFQIGRKEPTEIQVATDVMGFTRTTVKFRETLKVMCGRTGTADAVKCRESGCKYVPMMHRITYQGGRAFMCCAKCFIGMTIAPFYTLYHSKYWALCSYCSLHTKYDSGVDYPHPKSSVASGIVGDDDVLK